MGPTRPDPVPLLSCAQGRMAVAFVPCQLRHHLWLSGTTDTVGVDAQCGDMACLLVVDRAITHKYPWSP